MVTRTEIGRSSEAGFFCPSYVGVRCIPLFLVLEGHCWFEEYPIPAITSLTFAVPCFFVLSGFLISQTLFVYERFLRGLAIKTFYIRRALRILPVFYLALIVVNLVKTVPYFWWQFCYLMNWKIYLLSANAPYAFLNYVSYGDWKAIHLWSVDVEEQFYLLYPLFVFWTPKNWRTQLLCFGIGLTILVRFYFLVYEPDKFYGGLSIVSGEYILWGCLFAWLVRHEEIKWLCNSKALYLSVIIATFILSLRYSTDSYLGQALAWKPLHFFGRISYGAYLVHIFLNPVAVELAQMFPALRIFPQCPKAITGPLVTLMVATAMWYFFEEPINRLRRRWSPQA